VGQPSDKAVNLAWRTTVGFAALALILGVAIFTAAGSLSYWRGWVYLLVFLSSAAAITVYLWRADPGLLERRVNAGPAAVISSGPYALVRHPMYAGALLMLLATPLALGSWWGLLAFVPMLAAIVWRLRGEEELLSRQLPGYAEYRQQVRKRLIPGVW